MGFHPKPEEGSLSIRHQRTLHKKMPFPPPNSSVHFGLQPKPHTTQTTAGNEVTIKALSVLYFSAIFNIRDTQNCGCAGDKFCVYVYCIEQCGKKELFFKHSFQSCFQVFCGCSHSRERQRVGNP